MKPHRAELADVFRAHQSDFLAHWNPVLSRQQRKALKDIRDCRTAALGGHLHQCDRCGHRVILYNSCRNRHCPKCQATARAHWLAQREMELLPVPYFHVVFTLPQQIGRLGIESGQAQVKIGFLDVLKFPHPLMGRQLVHLFRAAGATNYLAGALLGMDHDQGLYKRWYRMTAESVGPAAVGNELMTSGEFDALLASARELEADPQAVVFKLPDVWVIVHL